MGRLQNNPSIGWAHPTFTHVCPLTCGNNSSDDVSLELVYVGWDFDDGHCDNSRIILDYNSS